MHGDQSGGHRRSRRIVIACASATMLAVIVTMAIVWARPTNDPAAQPDAAPSVPTPSPGNEQTAQSGDAVTFLRAYADGSPVVLSHLGVGTKDDSLPTLTEYFDYTCYFCARYDVEMGAELSDRAVDGDFNIAHQPVTTSGAAFAYPATTASLIVSQADPAHWVAFHHALLSYFHEQYNSGDGTVVQDGARSFEAVRTIAADAGVPDEVVSTFTPNSVGRYLTTTTNAWVAEDFDGRDPSTLGTPEFVRDQTTVIHSSGTSAQEILRSLVEGMEASSAVDGSHH